MKPLVLLILDGWGVRNSKKGNAILNAQTFFYNRLLETYPHTQLEASGTAVGLPKNFQGNSEVGHITIGSGRIIPEMVVKINQSIKNKLFFKNKAFKQTVKFIKEKKGNLHFMGLLQDQGVHAYAFLFSATNKAGVEAFGDAYDESAATRVFRLRYWVFELPCRFQPGRGGVQSIFERFFRCFAIGYASGQIWKGDQIAASFIFCHGANFKWIIRWFHSLISYAFFHQTDKLLNVNCFDRAMRRYCELSPTGMAKGHMARSRLSPLNSIGSSNGLQTVDAPIARIVTHFFQYFVCLAHLLMILNTVSNCKRNLQEIIIYTNY